MDINPISMELGLNKTNLWPTNEPNISLLEPLKEDVDGT